MYCVMCIVNCVLWSYNSSLSVTRRTAMEGNKEVKNDHSFNWDKNKEIKTQTNTNKQLNKQLF